MKKIIKNNLLGFILGILLCSGIVYGVTLYKSEDIQYQPSDESWEVSNVSEAINSLYQQKIEEEGTEFYLYDSGNTYDSVTGGWTTGFGTYVSLSFDQDHMIFKASNGNNGCNLTTKNKVDITNYKELYFEVDNHVINIGTMTNPNSNSLQRADHGYTTSVLLGNTQYELLENGHYLLKLSIEYLTGEHYIVMDTYMKTINVYKVYLK